MVHISFDVQNYGGYSVQNYGGCSLQNYGGCSVQNYGGLVLHLITLPTTPYGSGTSMLRLASRRTFVQLCASHGSPPGVRSASRRDQEGAQEADNSFLVQFE